MKHHVDSAIKKAYSILNRGEETGSFNPDAPAWDTGYKLKMNKHRQKTEAKRIIVLEHRRTNITRLIQH